MYQILPKLRMFQIIEDIRASRGRGEITEVWIEQDDGAACYPRDTPPRIDEEVFP